MGLWTRVFASGFGYLAFKAPPVPHVQEIAVQSFRCTVASNIIKNFHYCKPPVVMANSPKENTVAEYILLAVRIIL